MLYASFFCLFYVSEQLQRTLSTVLCFVIAEHGTTRVISSAGISNMQVGNKNIMYIGAMPGARSGSKRSTQAPKPFDTSKITSERSCACASELIHCAGHAGLPGVHFKWNVHMDLAPVCCVYVFWVYPFCNSSSQNPSES